jgi:hypothetical protein
VQHLVKLQYRDYPQLYRPSSCFSSSFSSSCLDLPEQWGHHGLIPRPHSQAIPISMVSIPPSPDPGSAFTPRRLVASAYSFLNVFPFSNLFILNAD